MTFSQEPLPSFSAEGDAKTQGSKQSREAEGEQNFFANLDLLSQAEREMTIEQLRARLERARRRAIADIEGPSTSPEL